MVGLLNTLQSASLSEAEDAFRRIRQPQESAASNLSSEQLRTTLNKYMRRGSPDSARSIGSARSTGSAGSAESLPSAAAKGDITTARKSPSDFASYRTGHDDDEDPTQSRVRASQLLQVVRDSSTLEIPSTQDSEKAVDAFFASSAKLFHVFSRDQAAELLQNVYHQELRDRTGASLCELCSIAAVGCMYSSDRIHDDLRETFYTVARLYLEESVDTDLFRGLKVCTLLAHYNVLDKSTVALSYVGQSSLFVRSSYMMRFWFEWTNLQLLCWPYLRVQAN